MWMAGYAARAKPAEGAVQDLFAKAVAIEDAAGTRLVIVAMDLIGVPRTLRESMEAEAARRYELPAESLLLNASHTHCGPELREKASIYGDEPTRGSQSREYLQELQGTLLRILGEALSRLEPARLSYTHGRAGFSMNRRFPSERGVINRPYPDGPVDQNVPVLRVEDAEGTLQAVVFGYACHNTTLSFYKFCGDYAGYAQEYLEAAHPDVTAVFITGCGGDQNPYPRRTLELAKQHGRALANGVEAALEAKPRPVDGPLAVALARVTLQFAEPPTRDELKALTESGNQYDRRRAEFLLAELQSTGRINTEYPYPVQVAQFGDDLTLVALAGEVVVDYSLRLKHELANHSAVWIAGYCNDVFGYVPSLRVLGEGGYEGGGAMRYTFLPGPFAPSIEQRIVETVHELTARVRRQATGR